MHKPWTMLTFPYHQPVWVRCKGATGGCMLVTAIAPAGVQLTFSPEGKGDAKTLGITWSELLIRWEQHNGSPCGERK